MIISHNSEGGKGQNQIGHLKQAYKSTVSQAKIKNPITGMSTGPCKTKQNPKNTENKTVAQG